MYEARIKENRAAPQQGGPVLSKGQEKRGMASAMPRSVCAEIWI